MTIDIDNIIHGTQVFINNNLIPYIILDNFLLDSSIIFNNRFDPKGGFVVAQDRMLLYDTPRNPMGIQKLFTRPVGSIQITYFSLEHFYKLQGIRQFSLSGAL